MGTRDGMTALAAAAAAEMATPLGRAHQALLDELPALDAAGAPEWRLIYDMADVLDYARRIVDHRDSTHYHAEKSGPLVGSALRVQRAALERHAVDPDGAGGDQIDRVHRHAVDLTEALTGVMWAGAHSRPLYTDEVVELRRVLREVGSLVDELATNAIEWDG